MLRSADIVDNNLECNAQVGKDPQKADLTSATSRHMMLSRNKFLSKTEDKPIASTENPIRVETKKNPPHFKMS